MTSALDALLEDDEDAARTALETAETDLLARLTLVVSRGRTALHVPGWKKLRRTLPQRQRALLRLAAARNDEPVVRELLEPLEDLVLVGTARDSRWGKRLEFDAAAISALPSLEHLRLVSASVAGTLSHSTLSRVDMAHTRGRLVLRTPELESIHLQASKLALEAETVPRLRSIDGPGVQLMRGELPALERAELAPGSQIDVSKSPRLVYLRTGGDVVGLRDHPTLEGVMIRGAFDPAELRCRKLRTLELPRCASLSELSVGALPVLEELVVQRSSLTSLDGVAAACPSLERLDAMWCSQLADVDDLDGHATLQVLDVRKTAVRSFHSLASLPSLRQLLVSSDRVRKSEIPERFHPMVRPRSLVATRKAHQSTRAKPKVRRGKKGSHIARLRKFLLTRSLDDIDSGVELAASLGDVETSDGLLEGTEVVARPGGLWIFGAYRDRTFPFDKFHANRTFEYRSRVVAPYREHALRALIAVAPPGSVGAALRERVGALHLDGTIRHGTYVPVDLGHLDRFPKLETLSVIAHGSLRRPETLERLGALRTLALNLREFDGSLRLPPSLRVFGLWSVDDRLAGVQGLEHLESLEVGSAGAEPIMRCARLRTLRWGTDDRLDVVGRLEHLERLSLPLAKDLRLLPRLPKLLHFEMPSALSVMAVPGRMPALTRLDIGSRLGGLDPAALRSKFPALETIGVFSYGARLAAAPLLDAGFQIVTSPYGARRFEDHAAVADRLLIER